MEFNHHQFSNVHLSLSYCDKAFFLLWYRDEIQGVFGKAAEVKLVINQFDNRNRTGNQAQRGEAGKQKG